MQSISKPGTSQNRPPEWICDISKTNIVFEKKTILCRKGGLFKGES